VSGMPLTPLRRGFRDARDVRAVVDELVRRGLLLVETDPQGVERYACNDLARQASAGGPAEKRVPDAVSG